MDYYSILEITKEASLEDIKKARNKMALKWHPDRNKENIEFATEKMKQINEAYEFLLNNKANKILNNVFNKYRKYKQQNFEQTFEQNVKMTFLNSKLKIVELKKTHKLSKPFNSFVSLITELNNLFIEMPEIPRNFKILLDEINNLISDKNNILWFKQFRNDNGIKLFYDLYLNDNYFKQNGRLQILWHKILKYGDGFKY